MEVDVSLADYAADLRAATPTDAARLVVPDRAEVLAHIEHLTSLQGTALGARASEYRLRTDRALSRLESALRYPRERVAAYEAKLERGLDRLLATARSHAQATATLQRRLTDEELSTLSNVLQKVVIDCDFG